jgi:hypothetical protein
MIAYSDTQSLLGARAPTQPVGLACADQNTFQATLDERTCGYGVWVRSIQYIRIASLRAVATLATVKCFWWQRCRYSFRNSGSKRTAMLAASTRRNRKSRLPCLLSHPSAAFLRMSAREGPIPDSWRPACHAESDAHLPGSAQRQVL